jgi:DNA processing protein
MHKLDYWVLLHSVPGIGPVAYNKLLQVFHEPQNVFKASYKELENIGINKKLIYFILSPPKIDLKSSEIKRRGFKVITLYDNAYPKALKSIKSPPPLLYVYGKFPNTKSIAIIGTTRPSTISARKAFEFAYKFALNGFTIVSGYAKGIDTQAHLGAIKGGGKTIMVLPMGVLNFNLHKEFRHIREETFSHSIILSEFPPLATWTTGQAMMRNRLTSGLADVVVVIDPGTKGGTISTVRWAKEQNKPVFILSPVTTKRGKEIIKLGAKEIKRPEDIIQ